MQETRLYDPDRGETRSMRSKEEANDYRYFPDPDLLPLVIDDALIERCARRCRSCRTRRPRASSREHGLSAYDAGVLTASRELADYYETVVRGLGGQPKLAANWVMGELSGALNKDGLEIGAEPGRRAARSRACSRASSTTRSPARSPRKCSRRCGPRAATPTRSSRRGA